MEHRNPDCSVYIGLPRLDTYSICGFPVPGAKQECVHDSKQRSWKWWQVADWSTIIGVTVFCPSRSKCHQCSVRSSHRPAFPPHRVDYERIKEVGPDRAASEWLLRCGAKVRYQGFERWQEDYNGLPTGPLGKYKIQGIDATESCIMYRGFDHLGKRAFFLFFLYLHFFLFL